MMRTTTVEQVVRVNQSQKLIVRHQRHWLEPENPNSILSTLMTCRQSEKLRRAPVSLTSILSESLEFQTPIRTIWSSPWNGRTNFASESSRVSKLESFGLRSWLTSTNHSCCGRTKRLINALWIVSKSAKKHATKVQIKSFVIVPPAPRLLLCSFKCPLIRSMRNYF